MIIILSQKIDSESAYADDILVTYHYPAKYKNQIHEGDIFIYYQGNKCKKEQRYYFGVGTVGQITTNDGENYYAALTNTQMFNNKVPIYLPDGGYVETIGYDTVRKSPNPPWQSSIRPLSEQAYDYILDKAGVQLAAESEASEDELKEQLKAQIKDYYLGNNDNAIFEIRDTAAAIIRVLNIAEKDTEIDRTFESTTRTNEKMESFFEYCERTRTTYSYKLVLIMVFFKCVNSNGKATLDKCVPLIRQFYQDRIDEGKCAEKKSCIYLNGEASDCDIKKNLISNPVKAICESGFFCYNTETQELVFKPELWPLVGESEKIKISSICKQRLEKYYND